MILPIIAVIFLSLLYLMFPRKDEGGGRRKNLILITIDTLSADKLGCYGSNVATPHIDGLAGEGVVFRRAYCQVPITLPSHATIMTGTYPFSHGIRHNGKFRLSKEATTLAEILRSCGYRTAAFVGASVLDGKYGLSQGFDRYDDEMPDLVYSGSPMHTDRRAGEVTRNCLEWLETAEEPFFIWAHYFDPHSPYEPPLPYRDLYDDPYDGEVAYVDSEVGRLLEAVSQMDSSPRTLIALTADHGESLGEHGEQTHAIFVYSSTTHVPLMMKLPGSIRPGVEDTSVVQLVDIMPTLLSVLGIEIPPDCEGRDLFDPGRSREITDADYAYAETWAPRLQYGWSELKSLRSREYLYVRAPHPEFYDLAVDSSETSNIFSAESGRIAYFESLLDSMLESGKRSTASEEVVLENTEREALESLGYVFHDHPQDSVLEDPKDMIGIHRDILEGTGLLANGMYDRALEILKGVLEKNEGDPSVYLNVGLCYDGLGEYGEALLFFKRAIELDPLEERAYYAAANVLGRMERFDESVEMLETLVTVYPEDPAARLTLARALSRSGDTDRAYRSYLEAVEIGSDDFRTYLDLGRFLTLRGRYPEALRELQRALELEPGCPSALALMGASFARTGDLERAAESFRSSLEGDSTSVSSWVDLGRILMELGEIADAKDALGHALSLDPENESAKRALDQLDVPGGDV